MIETKRLIKPDEDLAVEFPDLGFRNLVRLENQGNGVLICDPIYLADVYNSTDSIASYVKTHGAFATNFGGEIAGPIWFKSPYVLIPASDHLDDDNLEAPKGAKVLAEELPLDSGSLVFLPLRDDLPAELKNTIDELIDEENAIKLPLPKGVWSLWYEQYEENAPQENMRYFFRNIVLKQE